MKEKNMRAVDALNEAQKIAFAPLYFQATIAMRELGILDYILERTEPTKIASIIKDLNVSEYGVHLLLEAAESMGVVAYADERKESVILTKVGFFVAKDEMTRVNINFVNDVCYDGAKYLTDCIKTGKPEGLKVFGNWPTVYEGLSQLPEKIKTSWFEFDHHYSDNAFPAALEIVFRTKPKMLFDIGGNTGKWTLQCCNHDKDVHVTILDLPGQLQVSKKNVEANGFTDRVTFHAINLLDTTQKIPQGADVVWMSQFLDCFSKEEIVAILKNVYQAANENTIIYILEPFFDNQRYEAAKHSLIGTSLYFTVIANGNSKMYSVDVMRELVEEAGLTLRTSYPLLEGSYHTLFECVKK